MHFTTTQHERIIVNLPLYCLISDVVYIHIELLIVGYQQLACTACVVNTCLGNRTQFGKVHSCLYRGYEV